MTTKSPSTILAAIAFGMSFAAIAQTTAPGGSPTNAPAAGSTSAAGPKSGDRVPANRPDDPTAVCASVPAAEKEACMARENAVRSGAASSKSTPGSTQGSSTANNPETGTGKTK